MNAKPVILAGLLSVLAYLTLTKSGRNLAEKIGTSIMEFSAAGYDVIKRFEGFSPSPYRDAQGWSIGYGHFILPGENLSWVDQAQAEDLLRKDAARAVDTVNNLVDVPLSQNQFDALVSFTFNVGSGAFGRSTLLRLLNAGDYTAASEQFARWNRSQGEVIAALTTRRFKERDLFMTA